MRRRAPTLSLLLMLVAGCIGRIQEIPERQGDAGGVTDTDASTAIQPDGGGARDCTQPNACPCTSSYDCPADTYCHAESEMAIYCKPGARGAGLLGAPCPNGGSDCKSGVCQNPPTGSPVCSDVCIDNQQCAGSPLTTCTTLNVTPPAKLCL